jgi:hypothetical protein
MAKPQRPSKPVTGNEKAVASSVPEIAMTPPIAQPSPVNQEPPTRRTTYVEAVGFYERGVKALQRHDYRAANGLFETVLRRSIEEKELLERVAVL